VTCFCAVLAFLLKSSRLLCSMAIPGSSYDKEPSRRPRKALTPAKPSRKNVANIRLSRGPVRLGR
jgi:hypothetical protein